MANRRTENVQDQGRSTGSEVRRWSYDELCVEKPETNLPSELWDGELITSPAPSFLHQKICLRLYKALDSWVSARGLGDVVAGPVDLVLSRHRVVQPDVAFISQNRLGIIKQAIMGPADLVAEIISPGGRTRDRVEKKDLYEQYGVREYWIIDPEAETVEVLALTGGRYELSGRYGVEDVANSRLLPGFELGVRQLLLGD